MYNPYFSNSITIISEIKEVNLTLVIMILIVLVIYLFYNIFRSIIAGYEEIMKKTVPLKYIEALFVLGVILFIVNRHNISYNEDWFKRSLYYLSRNIF